MKKQILLNAFNTNSVGHINHGLWAHPRDRSVDDNACLLDVAFPTASGATLRKLAG